MIFATCNSCQQKYALPPEAAGQTKTCRKCGESILIPGSVKTHPDSSLRVDARQKPQDVASPTRPAPLDQPVGHSLIATIYQQHREVGWVLIGLVVTFAVIALINLDRLAPVADPPSILIDSPGDDKDTRQLGEKIYENSVPAVVRITAYRNHRKVGRGSGFFLHPGDKLVTNNHVVDQADHVIVETYWRRRIRIDKVLVRDSDRDLAILPVPDSFDPETLKLADRSHSVGETVFAVGSPKNTRFGISQGVIVQLREIKYGRRLRVQADISVQPGSSGGPLINRDGDVLGVMSSASPTNKKFTYAIHRDEIRKLLSMDLRLTDL